MKTIKHLSKMIIAGVLMTGFALNFNACMEQSPMSTNTDFQAPNQEIQILRHSDVPQGTLNKVVSVSQLVTVQDGGKLHIEHKAKKNLRINVTLTIAPGSISQDSKISMALDDELLIVSFAIPAGVTFSQLPNLTIAAQGLDLDNIDVEDLNLYYENSGEWTPVGTGSVSGIPGGSIIGAGGFGGASTDSRYAIGAE